LKNQTFTSVSNYKYHRDKGTMNSIIVTEPKVTALFEIIISILAI